MRARALLTLALLTATPAAVVAAPVVTVTASAPSAVADAAPVHRADAELQQEVWEDARDTGTTPVDRGPSWFSGVVAAGLGVLALAGLIIVG